MQYARLAPVSVGLVRGANAEPAAIVVKGTYRIDERGNALTSTDPEPISIDRPSPFAKEELYYASDFVPKKAGVDVLFVGHARAARPGKSIRIGVSFRQLKLGLEAFSEVPRKEIPLSAGHLFYHPTTENKRARLGPVAVGRTSGSPGDYNTAPPAHRIPSYAPGLKMSTIGLMGDGGGVIINMPQDEARVWVGAKQQTTELRMVCDTVWMDTDRAVLVLVWRGQFPAELPRNPYAIVMLGAGATPPSHDVLVQRPELASWTKVVELADFAPRSRPSSAGDAPPGHDWTAEPAPRPMRTREIAGQVIPSLAFDEDDDDDERETTTILSDAAQRAAAMKEAMDEARRQAARATDTTGQGTVMIDAASRLGPEQLARLARSAGLDGDSVTDITSIDDAHRGPPMPFDTSRHAPPPPLAALDDWQDGGATVIGRSPAFSDGPAFLSREETTTESAVPFSSHSAGHRPPAVSSAELDDWQHSLGGQTKYTTAPQIFEDLPPFLADDKAASSREPVPQPPPPATGAQETLLGLPAMAPAHHPSPVPSTAHPPMAAYPPSPLPPSAPLPSAPPPTAQAEVPPPLPLAAAPMSSPMTAGSIPLETYAKIKAALWDKRASLEDLLARYGLDELTWRKHEREQTIRVAKDATSGSGTLAKEIQAAIRQARKEASSATEMSLEDYARLYVRCERGQNPAETLRGHGISVGDWEQVQRSWQRRANADPHIADSLRRALATARSSP